MLHVVPISPAAQQVGHPRKAKRARATRPMTTRGRSTPRPNAKKSAVKPITPRSRCAVNVRLVNGMVVMVETFRLAAQVLAKQGAGAVQVGLDCFAGALECVGDLIDGQFFDIAQQDHLAVVVGQGLNCAGKVGA